MIQLHSMYKEGVKVKIEIDLLDKQRIELNALLENKAELGQYLTPISIARFMASFFEKEKLSNAKILDAGAGIGALTASLLERIVDEQKSPIHCECTLIEVDDILGSKIKHSLNLFKDTIDIDLNIISKDFIHWATELIDNQSNIFQEEMPLYSLAILNPPYKKIKSNSTHRKALSKVGIETVNLYSAFVSLAIKMLQDNGQLVAIIPRSFCNGAYYRSFRELILNETAIKHIHLFKSRDKAFKDDEVLQENIIILLEKNGLQQEVKISTSTDDSLNDYSEEFYTFEKIVEPNDTEHFFRIPSFEKESSLEIPAAIQYRLEELELQVSTGPVVSFRTKENLKMMPEENTVPLLYPTHITNDGIEWVKENHKKPNAILQNSSTEKWLYPMGYYLILRRRSAKEEKKRIISAVIEPALFKEAEKIGIDNGLNIIHFNKNGLTKEVAFGLDTYLKSTFVDQYFRSFNGSTQVNATDLRTMLFPSKEVLVQLGEWRETFGSYPSQEEIDNKLWEMMKFEGDRF